MSQKLEIAISNGHITVAGIPVAKFVDPTGEALYGQAIAVVQKKIKRRSTGGAVVSDIVDALKETPMTVAQLAEKFGDKYSRAYVQVTVSHLKKEGVVTDLEYGEASPTNGRRPFVYGVTGKVAQ